MMKKLTPFIAIGLAALVGLVLIGARVGLRYRVLGKITRLPKAEQRIQCMPAQRKLTAPEGLVQHVNLGYASFVTPTTVTLSAVSTSDGSCVVLTNSDFSIAFLAPFSMASFRAANSNAVTPLRGARTKHPELVAQMESYCADPIQAEIDVERAQYPTFWQVLTLGDDAFVALSLQLMQKAGCRRGQNEMFSFTSLQTKGLVRIGDSPDDRSVASASLASIQGDRHVGFHLHRNKESRLNIDEPLMALLASFAFTVDEIPSRKELIGLIAEAGIKHREDSQPSAAESPPQGVASPEP